MTQPHRVLESEAAKSPLLRTLVHTFLSPHRTVLRGAPLAEEPRVLPLPQTRAAPENV